MDPKQMVGLLYQMHVQQTISNNPPFHHIVENITLDDLDFSLINSITENNIADFAKQCFIKYKERQTNSAYGSVDFDPVIWTKIAIMNLSTEKPFVFPNGCCNQKICSINNFYEIILEQLLKTHRIINQPN